MNGRTFAIASLAGLAVAGVTVQHRRKGSFIRYGSHRPPVHPATQSPAFQAWFKQSAVVDAVHRPLVVYHGTPDARGLLEEGFRTHADRACWRRDDEGDVFFASASSRVADSYADPDRAWDFQGAEPAVVPLYLSIQNPLVVDAGGQRWRNTQHVIDRARAAGHDGVIIQNSIDYYDSPPPRTRVPTTTVYAWFSPTQAKSAGTAPLRSRVDGKPLAGSGPNAGGWDPANPVLSANRGSPVHSHAFNRWFSGSRVTHDGTASGEPLRVYHGTRVEFDTFKTRRGPDRLGAYFTASPEAAGKIHGGVPIVMPVYLRMRNPVDVRYVGRSLLANHLGLSKKAQWETREQGRAGAYATLEYLDRVHGLVPKLKKRGHDGIIFDGGHEGTTYVVFDPRQVKSATGNAGTYDARDPRISVNRTGSRAEDRHTKPNATRDVVRGSLVATLSGTLTIRIDHDRTCHSPTALLYDGDVNVGHAQLSRVIGPNDEHLDRYECRDEIRRLAERLQRMGHVSVTYWTMWRSELRNTYIGRGLGVDMYEAALRFVHAKFDKPAIIFPELCMDDGTTSTEAERVWGSLGRRWESEGWAVASVPLAYALGRRTPPWLRPQGSRARGSRDVGTFLDADLPGYLVGWRVMRYDPEQGDAVSGADSRQRVPLIQGAVTRLRGIGMFLGSTPAYVVDYYGGNDHNVLMRYAFRREDVNRGNLLDREPEIAVREAILLDWTIFDGEDGATIGSDAWAR